MGLLWTVVLIGIESEVVAVVVTAVVPTAATGRSTRKQVSENEVHQCVDRLTANRDPTMEVHGCYSTVVEN